MNAISNDFNGNSSGFSVSSVEWSTTTDNIPDYTKPYRTGTIKSGLLIRDLVGTMQGLYIGSPEEINKQTM